MTKEKFYKLVGMFSTDNNLFIHVHDNIPYIKLHKMNTVVMLYHVHTGGYILRGLGKEMEFETEEAAILTFRLMGGYDGWSLQE